MEESVCLPDDVLLYLTRFLNPQDCVALLLSKIFYRFDLLYVGKRNLNLSRCYFLTPKCFNAIFRPSISPSTIAKLDASHCYWIPAHCLLGGIVSMKRLKELNVQDTQITLAELPKVFESCRCLTRLSITFSVSNLAEFNAKKESSSAIEFLPGGFEKLTHLSVSALALNERYTIDTWLAVVTLLGWCRDCTDLRIEVDYTANDYHPSNKFADRQELDTIQSDQWELLNFAKLSWLVRLKSLVILKRGSPDDIFIRLFLRWILVDHRDDFRQAALQRLWIDEDVGELFVDGQLSEFLFDRSLSSLLFGKYSLAVDASTLQRFPRLRHIGGTGYSQLDCLPELRYARYYCRVSDEEGFLKFCRAHPHLENLCFHPNHCNVVLKGHQWRLPKLRRLVYSCFFLTKDLLEEIMSSCPDVEELHIGTLKWMVHAVTRNPIPNDSLCRIRSDRLKFLSLSGLHLQNGSFFDAMFASCPQLQILHISAVFQPEIFLKSMCRSLPHAQNLRHLRLEWRHQENDSVIMELLKTIASQSQALERLVLLSEVTGSPWTPPEPLDTFNPTNYLVEFVTAMEHLVALCFVWRWTPRVVHAVRERLLAEVQPKRPSLWFHVDCEPPRNDQIPRIHCSEIVYPVNYFDAGPHFSWL